MQDIAEYPEIYDANPELMKELEFLECHVVCDYKKHGVRDRPQLYVMIDSTTSLEDIEKSWAYIRIKRKMLIRYQRLYQWYGPKKYKRLVHFWSTPEGGDHNPMWIVRQLNNLIELDRMGTKSLGEEFEEPKGYPFTRDVIKQIIKDQRKSLARFSKDEGGGKLT